jgi:hypothetical protein
MEIKKQVRDNHLLTSDEKLACEVLKIAQMKTQNSSVQAKSADPGTAQSDVSNQKCSVPHSSTYQYDKTSGYFCDPCIGLYYVASS